MQNIYKNFVKCCFSMALVCAASDELQAQSKDQNYIQSRVPRREIRTATKLDQLTGTKDSVQQTINYFDGLGRSLQTVQVKGSSATGNDIIQPVAYDQYGREAVKYLPYTSSAINYGVYRADALTTGAGVFNFYNPAGNANPQQTNGVVRTAVPFAVTGFESSPLNRVMEQGAPGAPWQMPGTGDAGSNGHTVRMVYGANDQSAPTSTISANNMGSHKVALYTATINADGSRTLARAANTATYDTGELDLTIIRDENWQPAEGCVGTVEDYKDKNGNVVLKRSYNKIKSGSTFTVQMLSTYYVYDDMGYLAFVLPPGTNADATAAISATIMSYFAYQYRYDDRGRISGKKLPGKGWEYMVYNKLDQLVASQDSVQRTKAIQEWTVIKYDAMGRTILTGIYQHIGSVAGTDTRAAIQTLADTQTTLWETPVNTGNGYTNLTWPTTLSTTLMISYYDNYANIPGLPAVYNQLGQPNIRSIATGLLTATKVNILGSTNMLWSVNYYDGESRPLKSYKQHYLGGTAGYSVYNYDSDSTAYNFNDQPLLTVRKHFVKNAGNTAGTIRLTVADSYVYDHMGRKRSVYQQLQQGTANPQAQVLLSRTDYNETGQIKAKNLHSLDNGNTWLQTIDYRYNPRGWLASINNSSLTADGDVTNSNLNDQFGIELFYENTTTNTPQYNGNISTVKWKTAILNGIVQPQYGYDYSYDRINRLTESVSSTAGVKSNLYSEYLGYNTMGNITTLGRYENVSNVRTQIDTLTYTYVGNRHTRIDDAAAYTGPYGFTDATQGANEYTYDGNGNVKKDLNKDIASIIYNMLNLPQSITVNSITVNYTYDATGNKLKKQVTTGGSTVTTDYINGIQYTANTIDFLQTEEGRARPNGAVYKYEYDLKDHLGNSRVTLTWDAADATQLTPKILQQNNYYAFGASIKSLEPFVAMPKNEYLYNGKELQEETGFYDYGARQYDPMIGRWTTIDPLAEKMRRYSPYNYGFNNPIRFTDPDGMGPTDHIFNTQGQLIQITPTGHNILVKTDNGQLVNVVNLPFSGKNEQTIANIAGYYGAQVGIPRGTVGVAPSDKGLAYTKGDKIDINNRGGQISSILGNYDNMKSALVHEKDHLDKGQGYAANAPDNLQHAGVYSDQIADPTFKKTTTSFKTGMLGSVAGYLQDAYNKDGVQRTDVDGVLDKINKSISGYGYQLSVDPYSMNNMKINIFDNNKKKKDDKN